MGDVLDIDPSDYPGGIALWGAFPPVYDTTQLRVERGVHVHARLVPKGKKVIDSSYSLVRVHKDGIDVDISEEAAVAYVGAAILGLPLKYLECPRCKSPHLDLGTYALDPHGKHLCISCKVEFEDPDRAISNPVIRAKQLLNDPAIERQMRVRHAKPLKIDQRDSAFSGGLRIWGTHPAILWTAERDEDDGIHVHGYKRGVEVATIDETWPRVIIDGIELDPRAVRSFMVQQRSELLRDKLERVVCEGCGSALVADKAPAAIHASTTHRCACGEETRSERSVIANEMPSVVARLYESAKFAGLEPNRNRE